MLDVFGRPRIAGTLASLVLFGCTENKLKNNSLVDSINEIRFGSAVSTYGKDGEILFAERFADVKND